MKSEELLKEIESWLCFNTEPSKEETAKLRKSIKNHLTEATNDFILIGSCRTSVNWFAEQMELKLRDNDHKGGWARCEHSWLLDRLKQEVVELEKELDQVDNQENVIKEAADVANFALMIADLAGRLYGS